MKKQTTQLMMVTVLSVAAAGTAGGEDGAAPPVWDKPFTFSVDYTLVSDYVWRGINLLEYAGEGREKFNHQMTVGLALDSEKLTGTDFGTFSASFWFEWYAGQNDAAFGGGAHHLQEVDYTLSWSYDVPGTPVSVELGWIAYQFPWVAGDDAQWTHEV